MPHGAAKDVHGYATIRKRRAGERAWIGVTIRNKRASLIAVRCLEPSDRGCEIGSLAARDDCQANGPATIRVCRRKKISFVVSQCGPGGFVIVTEPDKDSLRACDLVQSISGTP